MNLNPVLSNQAQEVIISRKLQKANHNLVYFIHVTVQQVHSQKHFRMYHIKLIFWSI